jgi:hypothetical protein
MIDHLDVKTLNKDLVFQTCDHLESQNLPITQIAVRTALGFGSFSTIGPWIKLYKSQSISTDISEHQKVIPDALQKKLFDMGTEFWNYASVIAEKEREAFRDELADERKKIQLELEEKDKVILFLENDLEKTIKYNANLEDQIIELAAKASQIEIYKSVNETLQETIKEHLIFNKKATVKKPVTKKIIEK